MKGRVERWKDELRSLERSVADRLNARLAGVPVFRLKLGLVVLCLAAGSYFLSLVLAIFI